MTPTSAEVPPPYKALLNAMHSFLPIRKTRGNHNIRLSVSINLFVKSIHNSAISHFDTTFNG